MLQRHAKDKFAAGAYVFPGGMLEDHDYNDAALELSPRLTVAQAHSMMPDVSSPEKAPGFFIAAIRETFEESGILLARTGNGDPWHPAPDQTQHIRKARNELHDSEFDFNGWVGGMGLSLATEDFHYFAHWITPEIRPIRFDARFFVIEVNRGLKAEADQREVQNPVWVTPAEALAMHRNNEVTLLGATLRNLELLSTFPTATAAIEGLRSRIVEAILPKLKKQDDGSMSPVYPWDSEYQSL